MTWELSGELWDLSHPDDPREPDFLDPLRSLLAADARFMVVGAYAVGVHGRPRATKDLDGWVEPSVENAPKVMRALREFGAPLMGLTQKDLETPEAGLRIGREPLAFADAWPSRIYADFVSVTAFS